MARCIALACILFSCLLHQQAQANPLDIVDKALDFIESLRADERKIVDLYLKPESFKQRCNGTEVDRAIFERLRDLPSEEIRDLKTDFERMFEDVKDSGVNRSLSYMYQDLASLETKFEKLLKLQIGYTEEDMDKFSFAVLNYVTYTDSFTAGLAERLSASLRDWERKLMCERKRTPQQLLLGYYETLLKANLRNLALYRFVRDATNDTDDFTQLRLDPVGDAAMSIRANYPILKDNWRKLASSRKLWRCDPERHVKDETYVNLQPIFQRFIQYEGHTKLYEHAPWSPLDYRYEICNPHLPRCARYGGEARHRVQCNEGSGSSLCDLLPTKKRCTGYFTDCEALNPDDHTVAKVCLAPADSERRVNWIDGAIRSVRYSECLNNKLYQLRSISYEVNLNGNKYCAFCACTCVEYDADMDRYFGVEPVLADRSRNMVVTGARMVKVGRVFHIQVKQGELGARGAIDAGINGWKDVERPRFVESDDESLLWATTSKSYQQSPRDPYSVTNLTTYHSSPYGYPITYEQRTVYLDELEPSGENVVLTGLRFAPIRDALRLQVHVTPFDYDTGKLVGQGSWYPELRDDAVERTEVQLEHPDIPAFIHHHQAYSSSRRYIKFQLSDIKKDFGQTVVPFLDTQAVETEPPSPLAGAGLVHRGLFGSGGFLELTLTQYDFSKHG